MQDAEKTRGEFREQVEVLKREKQLLQSEAGGCFVAQNGWKTAENRRFSVLFDRFFRCFHGFSLDFQVEKIKKSAEKENSDVHEARAALDSKVKEAGGAVYHLKTTLKRSICLCIPLVSFSIVHAI